MNKLQPKRLTPLYMLINGPRDNIFRSVLSTKTLQNNPINVLQVGAIEELHSDYRIGSGWSDAFFASYIELFGGSLTVVDIDQEHLDNSKTVLSEFNCDHSLVLSNASKFIQDGDCRFDIIYLDGSNDPKETKEQYDKICKEKTSIILIDDYEIKGALIDHHENYIKTHFSVMNGFNVEVNTKALETFNKNNA